MNKLHTTLLALAVLAVVAPADAEELKCTTSEPDIDTKETTGAGQPRFYVDLDGMDAVWIYEETNGVAGLQRGDSMKDDTHGRLCYEPDDIVL